MASKRLTFLSLALVLSLSLLVSCGEEVENSKSLLPEQLTGSEIQKVGFDIDDTLLFSTPSFDEGYEADVEPFSDEFWAVVNEHDAEVSCLKPKVYKMVQNYQKRGAEVFAITARQPKNGKHLKKFIEKSFGIPAENVFFEPDSKTERIKSLELDVYFGDSDSDITDGRKAGITAVRIQRSDKSNY
ncbi:MAG: HAD family acid phosphatase, partial [bacterium]